jgi:hypothetical protein
MYATNRLHRVQPVELKSTPVKRRSKVVVAREVFLLNLKISRPG